MHDLKNLLIHILQELVFVKWTSEPEAVTLFARAYEVIWFDAQVIYKAKHGSVKRISEAHENDNLKYLSFLSQQYSRRQTTYEHDAEFIELVQL